MAKVVRFHAFGDPSVLRLDDLEVGDPGPGEVRLRVGAIGINRVEAQFRGGRYLPPALPSSLGYEAAGVVEAIGPGVDTVAPGDRVATLTGVPMDRYGVYAEKALFPADMLVQVLPGQSLVDAAACWMQYFTAYAIVSAGQVRKGDYVVITAASSSVGLAAIEIANAHGAIPIAVTRGRAKAEGLLKAGAAHVVVSDEEDVAQRVRAITQDAGARIVFDAVGGRLISALATCTAPGGILIAYGVLDGLPVDFPWINLLGLNLAVRGFAATILSQDPIARAEVIAFVNEGLRSGALKPVIDRTFPLDQIVEAHRHLESNTQFGKIIVTTPTCDE